MDYPFFAYPSPKAAVQPIKKIVSEAFVEMQYFCPEALATRTMSVAELPPGNIRRAVRERFPLRQRLIRQNLLSDDVKVLSVAKLSGVPSFMDKNGFWKEKEKRGPRCDSDRQGGDGGLSAWGYIAQALDHNDNPVMLFDLHSSEMGQYFIRWHGRASGWKMDEKTRLEHYKRYNRDEDFDPPILFFWGIFFILCETAPFFLAMVVFSEALLFFVIHKRKNSENPN